MPPSSFIVDPQPELLTPLPGASEHKARQLDHGACPRRARGAASCQARLRATRQTFDEHGASLVPAGDESSRHVPIFHVGWGHLATGQHTGKLTEMVATPAGFEPATTRLEGECSIQLSYGVFCSVLHCRAVRRGSVWNAIVAEIVSIAFRLFNAVMRRDHRKVEAMFGRESNCVLHALEL